MKENIVYKTDLLAQYFSKNRITWNQFYKSEHKIIEKLQLNINSSVLDIGCGCGGLGLALREKFGVENYTGIEINQLAVSTACDLNPKINIYCGDILNLSQHELKEKKYNVVFSLSCVDWNVRFSDMLSVAWNHVLPGGYLVATFRLTPEVGCRDMDRSYQFINFDGLLEGEKAAYVVLNADSLVCELNKSNPAEINAYGYWGTPSATAVTPYDQLCFSAFSIKKRVGGDTAPTIFHLDLPEEIKKIMKLVNA